MMGPIPAIDPDLCVLAEDVFPPRRRNRKPWSFVKLRHARRELRLARTPEDRQHIARRYGTTWCSLYQALYNNFGFRLRDEGLALKPGRASSLPAGSTE